MIHTKLGEQTYLLKQRIEQEKVTQAMIQKRDEWMYLEIIKLKEKHGKTVDRGIERRKTKLL